MGSLVIVVVLLGLAVLGYRAGGWSKLSNKSVTSSPEDRSESPRLIARKDPFIQAREKRSH